jgi:class 3 adenylate cyclase
MLLGLITITFDWLRPLESTLLDSQFRVLQEYFPAPLGTQVVVVGIDERTASEIDEPQALWHQHLGHLFAALARGRASVVGVDIVLPDRSFDSVLPGGDRALLEGLLTLRAVAPVVLGLTIEPSGTPRRIHPPFAAILGPASIGFVLLPIDSDGAVRRFDEQFGEQGERIPTLAGEMASHLGRTATKGIIDFSRGGSPDVISLRDVLAAAAGGDESWLLDRFQGRPVLVGSVQPFVDRLAVAVPLGGDIPDRLLTPGVLVHAQVLKNILGGWMISPVPAWSVAVLVVLISVLWLAGRRLSTAVPAFIVTVFALYAGSTWLLRQNWQLPAIGLMFTAFLVVAARYGLTTWGQVSERRRLRRAFSGYVSPAVMRGILNEEMDKGLGGRHFRICVMFCDIREFTKRAEAMPAAEVIALLNRYFTKVVSIVHECGGTVDKFIGDGLMAFFGAPNELPNPAESGFECACRVIEDIGHFNLALAADGHAPLRIGIGLHIGDAIVGHVGSDLRHNYTAIGDVVNVASRLERLTKEVGHVLVLSENVVADIVDAHAARPLVALGPQTIRGHTAMVLYGYSPAASPNQNT